MSPGWREESVTEESGDFIVVVVALIFSVHWFMDFACSQCFRVSEFLKDIELIYLSTVCKAVRSFYSEQRHRTICYTFIQHTYEPL